MMTKGDLMTTKDEPLIRYGTNKNFREGLRSPRRMEEETAIATQQKPRYRRIYPAGNLKYRNPSNAHTAALYGGVYAKRKPRLIVSQHVVQPSDPPYPLAPPILAVLLGFFETL